MKKSAYRPFHDPTLLGIILSNLVSIYLAYANDWDFGNILWVYWGQSVIIGISNYLRMMSLKDFSTKDFMMNDEPVPETDEAKKQVAGFFAIHYGLFHLAYFAFLCKEHSLLQIPFDQVALIVVAISLFVGSHSYSFLHNGQYDFKQQKPNIGTLMFYPYLRIIPMHLIIGVGGTAFEVMSMFIFMGLKTLADIGMHAVEHHMFQKVKDKAVLKD